MSIGQDQKSHNSETPDPTLPGSINIDKAVEWFEWEDIPELRPALTEACCFLRDQQAGGKPRWLTLSGHSGVGKSHLIKQLWEKRFKYLPALRSTYKPSWLYWPSVTKSDALLDDCRHWPVVALDDIAPTRWDSDLDKLLCVLEARQGEWTMITSNLSQSEWAEIDVRIASRLTRRKSRLVQIEYNKDYDKR